MFKFAGPALRATAFALTLGMSALSAAPALAVPVEVISVSAPAAGTYRPGDVLSFIVTFDVPATVTGTPLLGLTIGATPVEALYASGSGSPSLTFNYTVLAGQADADGIAVGALALNGGMIENGADAAVLTLNAVQPTTDVLVAGPLTPAAVPTMSEWAMILLGAGLAVGGTLYLRRRLLLPS